MYKCCIQMHDNSSDDCFTRHVHLLLLPSQSHQQTAIVIFMLASAVREQCDKQEVNSEGRLVVVNKPWLFCDRAAEHYLCHMNLTKRKRAEPLGSNSTNRVQK